jgi:hypothetical protein
MITMSWWQVTIPLWGAFGVALIAILIGCIITGMRA